MAAGDGKSGGEVEDCGEKEGSAREQQPGQPRPSRETVHPGEVQIRSSAYITTDSTPSSSRLDPNT